MKMDPIKEKILERIAKLINLGKSQDDTEEGKSALKMASRLMAKHRIAESEIDLSTDSLTQDIVEGIMDEGGIRQWVLDLGTTLAYTFDTKFHFTRSNFHLTFVGTDSDIETVTYFMEIVMHHIESEARKMWPADRNWRKRNEFGTAASQVVRTRLYDMKKQMTKTEKGEDNAGDSDCSALVVQKIDKVQKVYTEAFPNIKGARRKDIKLTDRKTWEAGRKAGESAPLNLGITA
jgi:hypothetical protein